MERTKLTRATVLLILGSVLGGFIFTDLAVANFLPLAFMPSNPLTWGIWIAVFLPWTEILYAFPSLFALGAGLPAFAAFVILILCVTLLRAKSVGLSRSVYDSLTAIAPFILVLFELSILVYYPNWVNAYVTTFVSRIGLGRIVTNLFVMGVSTALLCFRLLTSTGVVTALRGATRGKSRDTGTRTNDQ